MFIGVFFVHAVTAEFVLVLGTGDFTNNSPS